MYYTTARFNASLATKTTDNLAEGLSNFYFTNTRARDALSASSPLSYNSTTGQFSIAAATSTVNGYLSSVDWSTFNNKENQITAGTTSQYYRGDKTFQTLNTAAVPENGTNVYYTTARFNASLATKTTDNLAEGLSNFYFTNTRARDALSASSPLSYNSTTGQFSIAAATSTVNGYLSSVDWSTFNNKENQITAGTTSQYYRGDKTFQTLNTTAVTEGSNLYYTTARFNTDFATKTTDNLTEGLTNFYFTNTRARDALSAASPLSYNSGTGQFSIPVATSSANGYLSSTDWSSFNSKLSSTLADGLIWVGNASNIATPVSVSGDATLSNAGVLTIGSGAITSGKIFDGTIVDADINSSAGITITKISGGSNIVTSLGVPSGSNANGGSIASNALTFSFADGTNPGIMSVSTQSFAGNKTFGGNLIVNGNSTLGDASSDTLIINGSVASIPNGLDFNTGGGSPYSVFKISNMTANFGGLVETGGFLGNNSYFAEEFNADTSNGVNSDNATIGDDGTMYFDTTSTQVSYTAFDGIGGFAAMDFGSPSGTAGLIGFGAAQNNLSLIFSKASLPVLQMKVKTNNAIVSEDTVWGFMDKATATTTNDTLPDNGIFFWHDNGTSWVGHVRSGGVDVGTTTCTGTISTTQFAVGRIQVESATSVRFLMDYDVSDGISFTDCGTVSGANPTAALGVALYNIHSASGAGTQIDLDYIRVWQDDCSISTSDPLPITKNENKTQYNYEDTLVDGSTLYQRVRDETFEDSQTAFTYYTDRNMDISSRMVSARMYAARISAEKILAASHMAIATRDTSYRFQVGDTINYGYVDNFGAWQSSSDERFKENMTRIEDSLSLVKRMEGIRYNVIGSEAKQIGFSAQKMEEIVPEIVSTDDQGYKGIAYSQLTPILVNAIKEQQGQIDTLKNQIAAASNNNIGSVAIYELNNLVISGALSISGHITLDADSVGEAIINFGNSSARVMFVNPYEFIPIITATPVDGYAPIYVKDIDYEGFTVAIGPNHILDKDLKFFWHAFAKKGMIINNIPDTPIPILEPENSQPQIEVSEDDISEESDNQSEIEDNILEEPDNQSEDNIEEEIDSPTEETDSEEDVSQTSLEENTPEAVVQPDEIQL